MSEEIGLRRHVAFADPRLERSTAVKCTEADHYISTTARSDICVLPVCLSLFKSLSWTALEIRVVNQDPVPFTKQCCCFQKQTDLNTFAVSIQADFSSHFEMLFFFFFKAILFCSPFLILLTVCVWATEIYAEACVQAECFGSILQCRCSFLFTEVHGKEYKEVESVATLQ